jgi:uncharacterized protein (DUF1501 family)
MKDGTDKTMMLGRRSLIRMAGGGAMAGALGWPGLALANVGTDARLVIVIQRGAMDGLAAVPPYGDSQYAARRKGLALPMPGETDGILRLDATFGLHPALTMMSGLWQQGQFTVVPATFGGYHTRSHFDAQDLLETGLTRTSGSAAGWLNRALALMPAPAGERLGLSLGAEVPLTLRGAVPVANWQPPNLHEASPSLLAAMTRLYSNDALFATALADGIKAQNLSDEVMGNGNGRAAVPGKGQFVVLASAAGRLLATPDGPRVAVLDLGGWDTHVGQGTVKGRLTQALTQLENGLDALKTELGSDWNKTVVVCVTEFGRTASPNGTGGTDHGTASMTLVLGGAVKGGRITGDWAGLDRLEENRDLRGATDIRSVLKGVLRDHMGIEQAKLDATVFPDSHGVRSMPGLVRV